MNKTGACSRGMRRAAVDTSHGQPAPFEARPPSLVQGRRRGVVPAALCAEGSNATHAPMRALGSHGRVLRSVLGAGEAHIENAPVLRAVLVVRVRIRGLAGPQGHVVFRRIVLLALLDVMPRARPDGRHVVEEAL
eukprot:CAMPEP_0170396678 /NCGR_PEP_ID=MMETSP0117_2-20130122/22459_1 /TAXON_ID=400756 /ORGANISM="Durinskia baltica, Strain CSIRO CS-38" /LENGTH=134 /DNA_ID=CAMNT_0010653109 /DNA_START=180 /DNA_END=582 /DNA_ORIENTATION=-